MANLRSLLLCAVVSAAFLAPSSAQGTNCNLLGTYANHGPFTDVWGYVAPNGDEYALLATIDGTVVIDITNPATPIERGYFLWASSGWRDIRTYQQYAYVGSENGAGFQILDLGSPNSPTVVGILGTANNSDSHNMCIDTGAGRLYLVGTGTGNPVYDLTTNPTNPTFLGHMAGAGNANYYHDLCVENGYAYGAMIYNGVLRIHDVSSTFPPPILSSTSTPGTFTHNAWPNAAGTVCVTTDEVTGGVVKFWDVTNKSSPQPLGQFTPNPASVPHNAYIVGDLCHVSWYTEGYRCIDISNPNAPVEVASYDTWPGPSGGFSGAWGCYPFLPSGNILISDRSTGLYIVKPNFTDMAIAHTPLGDTSNEDGPYTVLCDVTTSSAISSVTLHWREGNTGAFTATSMLATAQPNQYTGDIPGHDAVAEMQYFIEGIDNVGTARDPISGQHSFNIGSIGQIWSDGFETDLGWTHGGTQDDWQRGTPVGVSGTSGGVPWQDPVGAYAGSNAFGNDLGGPGFNGSYENNASNWLQSPVILTNGVQDLRLRFRRWLQLGTTADYVIVKVNGINITAYLGVHDTSWQQIALDISGVTNSATSAQIRFELVSDGSVVSGGWTIDEVELVGITDCAPPLIYGNGTAGTAGVPVISLAAPAGIGSTTQIEGSNIRANAPLFAVLNLAPDNTPVFGITALVQSPGAVHFVTASAGGAVSIPFVVPNNPVFDNLYIYSQIIPIDAGGPQGLAATPGMRFRVCLQ